MRVCVIGTGYVGLVTGACLAYVGHDVVCVDNNEEKVKLMKSGQSPIHEPGLPKIISESIRQGKIEFTTDIAAGVNHGEVLFIAVGTPSLPDGRSDMRYVEAVARSIGESLTGRYRDWETKYRVYGFMFHPEGKIETRSILYNFYDNICVPTRLS